MAEKTFDVTALGELLIDFTENGVSKQGKLRAGAWPEGAGRNRSRGDAGLRQRRCLPGDGKERRYSFAEFQYTDIPIRTKYNI